MDTIKLNIGAALIVRNEENNLPKALNSVKNICRQVVVVDTGSSDKTSSIAARMGADIHFFKWADDFSAARNYSLNMLRTEWALVIDADEILNVDSFNKNIHLFNKSNCGGIRIILKNHLQDGSLVKEHKYPRIFRVKKGIRFVGKIHEQINDSILKSGEESV